MEKVDVSELKRSLKELMEQVGGQNGQAHLEQFKLRLNGVVLAALEVLVDLSVPCKLPFADAKRISRAKSEVVKLERRGDDLYLDGVKLERFLSENQKAGRVTGGHDLRKEIEARGGQVSAKVLDTCALHPEFWPESWKKDARGDTIYVFFWDDIFGSPTNSNLYVRYGYWIEGKVVSDCLWLGYNWYGLDHAASRAS